MGVREELRSFKSESASFALYLLKNLFENL